MYALEVSYNHLIPGSSSKFFLMFFCEKRLVKDSMTAFFSDIAYNGSLARDGKLIMEFHEGSSENIIY